MNDQTGAALLHGNAMKIASSPVVSPSDRAIDPTSLPRGSFRDLDRATAAAMARMTGGLSPAALWLAYSDWTMHFGAAHGKQLELAKRCGRRRNVGPRHRLRTADFAETPGNNLPSGVVHAARRASVLSPARRGAVITF